MPQAAIDAEIGGTLVLGVRVEETGKVDKVWITAGPAWPCGKTPQKAINKLADTLSDTMKNVKFTPAIHNGKAVTENVAVTIKLDNPKLPPDPLKVDVVGGRTNSTLANMGVVLGGRAVSMPKPAYPPSAREVRAGGPVAVQVVIDEDGKVMRAGAVTGAPELQYAAREAACEAKFSKTTLNAKPIKVSGNVIYHFVAPPMR